ncbi:phosphatidylglycerophosphatase A family protein [Pseudodonghicola flavimaris]|uniref:Phosphatidylglycerophosphatase A n=1 Tax=Pseudodonghicola flavimaris TaxID=3050036 RepID=A0ABT7EV97_9RHOB|nr:phosphatidylglycerophosphatase A [Pseudodonghicola flavimaris]MDK3016269.1 phosphatidylglycerophosphatase A [Pseudodonghicola flavimaris]
MLRAINTFGFVGLLRPAPGTWGSLVAVLLGWAIEHWLGFIPLLVAFVAVTVLGFATVGAALKDRPGEDPSEIVIDEVAGQWLALLFPAMGFWMRDFPMVWPGPVAAFLLFRLFDIWKPWLVGRADRRHDAAGVMLDDLWAGIFAGIVSIFLAGLYHGVMMR